MAEKNTSFFSLLKATAKEFMTEDPFRQSAVVAYYSIFSLPALLIISIWVASTFVSEEAIQGQIREQVGSMLGPDTGQQIETMISNAQKQKSSLAMKIVGIATLLFGATTVFFQLQKSLNHIWEVEQDPRASWKKMAKDRGLSLGLIIVIGFLLLISLVASALINSLGDWIKANFPSYMFYVIEIANIILWLCLATFLFAIIFKVLPDVEVKWRMVWRGAFLTSILFVIGKFLISLYFGMAEPGSTYGAAGSIILILIWVNYTCLILFFGAEFTQVHARRKGHRIIPSENARWVAKKRMELDPGAASSSS
ncbi:MAG: YihY/virulence factor BrkB family protein [Candidatus Cyclobacteriaceae bacterium M2_1C_046]